MPSQKLSGCLETSISRVIPWKFHHCSSQFRGRGCSQPFITGVVENPSNPTGFLGCQCQSSPPKPQNSVQWIHTTTAPPVLRDSSLRPNKPKIFMKRLKLDPNLGLIHSGHVAARRIQINLPQDPSSVCQDLK